MAEMCQPACLSPAVPTDPDHVSAIVEHFKELDSRGILVEVRQAKQ